MAQPDRLVRVALVTDPRARDFGLKHCRIRWRPGLTVRRAVAQAFPGADTPELAAYHNLAPAHSLDAPVKPGDAVLAGATVEDSRVLMSVAMIAVAIAAPYAIGAMTGGSLLTFAGMGAQATISMYQAGAMILGGLAVSALMPADSPMRGEIGQDRSQARQFGATPTSDQMLPVKLVWGHMRVRGNMVSMRTETRNRQASGISVQDTHYSLWGICANEIDSLEEIYVDGMAVSTFAAADVSAYYTKGTADQHPVSALSTDAGGVFLFHDGGTPAPAPADRYLFPAITVESLPGQLLADPTHCFDMTETTEDVNECTGLINTPQIILDADIGAAATEIAYKYRQADWDAYEAANGALTIPATGWAGMVRGDVVREWIRWSAKGVETTTDGWTSGTLTIAERWGGRAHLMTYTPDRMHTSDQTTLVLRGNELVGTRTVKVPAGTYDGGSCEWQPNTWHNNNAWYTYTSARTDIEDIALQLTFPAGLCRFTHHGRMAERWVTFELHVMQYDATGATLLKDTKFTPPVDPDDNTSPIDNADLPDSLWVKEALQRAFAVKISAIDVLTELDTGGDAWSSPSGTFLELDGTTGFLPSGYIYKFAIRKHGHGSRAEDIWFSTVDPDNPGGYQDIDQVRVYRVQEFNYGELLTNPTAATCALVLNSTDVTGDRLPDVAFEIKSKVKYYDAGHAGIDQGDLSTWPEGYLDGSSNEVGRNPGWICLTMLWNTRWGARVGGYESSATKAAKFARQVDIAQWIAFAAHCQTARTLAGDSVAGYTFDGEFNEEVSVWGFLQQVCRVARGNPVQAPKLSVRWDQEYDATDNPITDMFSASDFVEGSFVEEWIPQTDLVHAMTGSFKDSEASWEDTVLTWIDPTVTDPDPSRSQSIDLFGLVEQARALEALKYRLKKTRTIQRVVSGDLDTQAVTGEVGDIVTVQSEFVEWGAAEGDSPVGGRLQAISTGDSELTLDKLIDDPGGTRKILVRTSEGDLVTKTISAWDNTGTTTVLTCSTATDLDAMARFDAYIIGQTDYVGKDFVLSKVQVNGDMTTSIEAVEYAADPFGDLDVFSVSLTGRPEITQALYAVRNLTLTQIPAEQYIEVTWDRPNAYAGRDHDYALAGYHVYRKINDGAYTYQGRTNQEMYADRDVAPGETYYYKVATLIRINGVDAATPFGWCTAAIAGDDVDDGIEFKYQFLETLESPTWDYEVHPNPDRPGQVDLAISITDPEDWWRRDRREGYQVWMRTAMTDDSTKWLGPTGITTTGALAAGASSMTVSSVTGLTIPGLVWVDGRDLVYVEDNTGTTLDLGVTDTNRRFALSFAHASGVSVTNAHKGFFPIIAFGLQDGIASLSEQSRHVNLTTWYKATYSDTTGLVTVGAGSDLRVLNAEPELYRYIQGKTHAVGQIERFTENGIVLDQSGGGYVPLRADWSVNMAFRDVTGERNRIYYLMWATPTSAPIMVGADGDIYATLEGLPQEGYAWVGCNRLYYQYARDGANYGWISGIGVG